MLGNCRVCLKKETNLLTTSTTIPDKDITYNEELMFCVPEITWAYDKSPSFICQKCINQLEIVVDFRRLCLDSDRTRKKYIENLNEKDSNTLLSSKAIRTCDGDDNNDEHDLPCDNNNDNDHESNITQRTVNKSIINKSKKNIVRKCNVKNKSNENAKYYTPKKKDRICIFCNSEFKKYTALVNHIRSIHTFEKCFKCDTCGEGFTNSEILARHKNKHTGERKYVCSYCGKNYFTNSDLYHHVQRHENKRNYKCGVCENKSFNTSNGLRTHKLLVHTNPNEWKFLCTICGLKCFTQTILTVHIKRHSKDKDFCCHLCSKKFYTKSELTRHITSHSNIRLHKCNVCNKEYKSKKIMEMHLTKKHNVGETRIIERVKKHFCDKCPKKFISKKQLEKHIRAHNGEKPFKCNLCDQAFICNSYIKGHIKSRHPLTNSADQ